MPEFSRSRRSRVRELVSWRIETLIRVDLEDGAINYRFLGDISRIERASDISVSCETFSVNLFGATSYNVGALSRTSSPSLFLSLLKEFRREVFHDARPYRHHEQIQRRIIYLRGGSARRVTSIRHR